MSAYDLILIVLVGAGAFYAGYQLGRFKALSERAPSPVQPEEDSPLPGPSFDRRETAPSRPRGSPPPASAGNDGGPSWSEADAGGRSSPPRRSTKPPPAAAGLMDKGSSDKRG
jgi:hypothetical protein